MRELNLFLTVYFTIAAFSQDRPRISPAGSERLVSTRHGFSIRPPAGWHSATQAADDLPIFANVPWANLPADLIFPRGMATIHIVAETALPGRNHDYTIEDWAEFDERGAARKTATTRELSPPKETRISKAIITTFDERADGASERRQHHTAVYWELGSKRFATYLDYAAGDPKAMEYENALIEATRSIRPLEKP